MKAFLSIKYHADQRNRARIEMISSALQACGIESVCIARDVERWGELQFDARELMHRTFAALDACDWVVIDLTEKGVGVGIEAGYARAKNIPIVTIAQESADISETLRGLSRETFLYDDSANLSEFFERVIQDA
jgi:nucleoside 2-deoxyribosyltransferase